jgi:hypothetical protein
MRLFGKPSGAHLRISVEPSRVRRGEEVVARVHLADLDARTGELFAGLRCRRNQRRTGVTTEGFRIEDPIFETYDRHEVYSDWRPLEGNGPWEVRFTVPPDAKPSKDPRGGTRHSWRVEVRERRKGARDPAAHSSLLVR